MATGRLRNTASLSRLPRTRRHNTAFVASGSRLEIPEVSPHNAEVVWTPAQFDSEQIGLPSYLLQVRDEEDRLVSAMRLDRASLGGPSANCNPDGPTPSPSGHGRVG